MGVGESVYEGILRERKEGRKEGRETYLEYFRSLAVAPFFWASYVTCFHAILGLLSSSGQCGSFFLSHYLWAAHPNVSGQLE